MSIGLTTENVFQRNAQLYVVPMNEVVDTVCRSSLMKSKLDIQ